jgi:xylulokinase
MKNSASAKQPCLLGFDIGTSRAKGILCSAGGNIIAQAQCFTGLTTTGTSVMEQDPEKVWWHSFCEITNSLVEKIPAAYEIAAIGCSGVFPSLVALDKDGVPLTGGILYLDSRGEKDLSALSLPGKRTVPTILSSKIVWLKRYQPDIFKRIRMILSSVGYLVYKLTGMFAVDSTLASDIHLQSSNFSAWNSDVFPVLGLSEDMLPPVGQSTSITGTVTGNASRETGLPEGTPVICGTGDTAAEAVAAGAVENDTALLIYGTTGCVLQVTGKNVCPESLGICAHAVPNLNMLIGGTSSFTSVLDWFAELTGEPNSGSDIVSSAEIYRKLNEGAAAVSAGSDGLIILPHFRGARAPIRDPRAKGVIIGLTMASGKEHIYRALLEGVAYSIRNIIETMEGADTLPETLLACGGGFNNVLLRQIISDVTQRRQRGTAPANSAIGAAYLAGLGIGLFDNFKVLLQEWTNTAPIEIVPDLQSKTIYDDYYDLYKQLYPQLRPCLHTLSQITPGLQGDSK